MFSIEEIRFLLELIAEKYGTDAEDEPVAKIQGKLAMMFEYKSGDVWTK